MYEFSVRPHYYYLLHAHGSTIDHWSKIIHLISDLSTAPAIGLIRGSTPNPLLSIQIWKENSPAKVLLSSSWSKDFEYY